VNSLPSIATKKVSKMIIISKEACDNNAHDTIKTTWGLKKRIKIGIRASLGTY
jgi:hypothetical protein